MFLERFDRTYKDHFESFRVLLIGLVHVYFTFTFMHNHITDIGQNSIQTSEHSKIAE